MKSCNNPTTPLTKFTCKKEKEKNSKVIDKQSSIAALPHLRFRILIAFIVVPVFTVNNTVCRLLPV